MTTALSILWRLVLSMGTLLLLASCGIEQSTPASRPPGAAPPVMSPPLPTAPLPTALATLAATPPSPSSPSATALSQVPTLVPSSTPPTGLTQTARITVTLADNGKTIPLAVGQTFLLSLAPDYDWTVKVDDAGIVGPVANPVVRGTQGVYEAKRAGTTALHATGGMICPPGKACIQIALEFRVQLAVR